jgi:tetratricopeptide (TPR) repeat protein
VPATAQSLALLWERLRGFRFRRLLAGLLALAVLGGVLVYKQLGVIESHRFGTGTSELVFPVGATRFVVDKDLSGNMYNMDAFGGYLSFMVSPQRRIFNYHQPGVFTALFDYLHKPETRPQWQINYAFVGTSEEIRMFEQDGFVPVYWEPGSALFVRDSAANAEIIGKYRLHYFRPLLADRELLAYGREPRSAEQLLQELSQYLTYRRDPRIARILAQLLRESPAARDDRQRTTLLLPALQYNADSADLLALQGEIAYRGGDAAKGEALFMAVLDRDPANVPARIGLGYLLYDRKDFAKAQEHFAIVTREHPEAADAHYALALAAFRLCQRQQARQGFEKFLELAPSSPYAAKAKAFLDNLDKGCGS